MSGKSGLRPQNKVLVLVVLASLVLLSSCSYFTGSPGIPPSGLQEVFVGTDGVVAQFSANNPPTETFANTKSGVRFSLQNKGAEYIRNGMYAVTVNPGAFLSLDTTKSQGFFELAPRSSADVAGELKFFEVSASIAPLPQVVQSAKETVTVHECYPYKTHAVTNVCVDTDVSQTRNVQKVCTEGTKAVSGGQGAPVALSSVQLRSFASTNQGKVDPQIVVTLKNVGGGELSLPSDIFDICNGRSPKSSNKARVSAFLSETELSCTPSEVTFTGGTATTTCILPNGLDTIYGNFYALFRLEAEYGYHQSTSQTVQIRKPGI